jgi:hypothetical protein
MRLSVAVAVCAACFVEVVDARDGKHRTQPFEYTSKWTRVAPINGSGYCGPASLYHIISYYQDFGRFYVQSPPEKKSNDGEVDIRPMDPEMPVFIDDTAFGKYIQPNGMGSSWKLLKKVTKLRRAANSGSLYDAYVCQSGTRLKDIGKRRMRLEYIRENLLNRNMPVVIHLQSSIPFCGHYVTLVGFDSRRSTVYYADSLRSRSGVQSVSLEEFLGSWFYVSGKYYKARWDGEWMAIWHAEDAAPCDRCGD